MPSTRSGNIESKVQEWEKPSPVRWVSRTPKGISQRVVEEISWLKNEPDWMREKRLAAYQIFEQKGMPVWGVDLSGLNFDEITFFIRPEDRQFKTWDEVPADIREVYDKLGIPQAEQKMLAGLVGQYESEGFYAKLKDRWERQGVIFTDTDTAVKKYPDLVKEYFMTRCVPIADHKFAALHGATWSGGSFVYVPAGVQVDLPLQTYFRMNAPQSGQFEHTLIIAEEGSSVHYLESCTAPKYSTDSLHSAVVEIFAKKGSSVRYTTIQNWSKNVYNLNTKRSLVYEDANMEWVGGSLGCLTGDTLIFTNPGEPVPIKDVKAGTPIYSLDLNVMRLVRTKVKAFRNSGVKKVFEIRTENGRTIRASASHPFLVYDRVQKILGWKPAEQVEANQNQYLAIVNLLPDEGKPYSLPSVTPYRAKNTISFPPETTEELMWVLGIYLGDGFIEKGKLNSSSPRSVKIDRRVFFAIPPTDPVRGKVIEALQRMFGCKVTTKGICVTLNSRMLCEFIRALGFSGLAGTKRVPRWIFSLPHAQKLAFIEGYLDADGHVRKKFSIRKRIPTGATFTSCNPDLLEDVRMLMITCGLNPGNLLSHTRKRPSPTARGDRAYTNYAFNLPGHEVAIIRSHQPISAPEVLFSRVVSVHDRGEESTYDLEIDGPPNFIANGIIVHNSKMTMLYPMSVLLGKGASARHLNIATAGAGQWKDTGAKILHGAPYTSSRVISKSIAMEGGRSSYRGLLKIAKGAHGAKAHVQCDALLVDDRSQSDTYPHMEIYEDDVSIMHEATVNRVTDDQLFYLRSRGLSEDQSLDLILSGFLDPISRELPLDYALELNRLIRMEMAGSVG